VWRSVVGKKADSRTVPSLRAREEVYISVSAAGWKRTEIGPFSVGADRDRQENGKQELCA
jgi:hypothetical protein